MALFSANARDGADHLSEFTELETRAGSHIGVAVFDSTDEKVVEYHAHQRFPMCSTFKVLAVAAVLKGVDNGEEKLDRFVRYGEADLLAYAPVTREHVKEGGMSLEALCAAAIEQSTILRGICCSKSSAARTASLSSPGRWVMIQRDWTALNLI